MSHHETMRVPGTPVLRTEIPTDIQIRALHEKYAPTREAFDLVYTHCQIVQAVAEQLAAGQGHAVDAALVRAGSLLHDLGVYRLYSPAGELDHGNYIRHGVLGYELLQHLGFPRRICRFCSCHTGVGLNRDDIVQQNLPIPVDDYLPESIEEELVMYADKFHSKTTPPVFVTAATYTRAIRRFGADKADTFTAMREKFGDPDLTPLVNLYRHSLS